MPYNALPSNNSSSPVVALVLSGGAARGFAHLGVLSVLQEYNIPVHFMVSTSFGSIIAAYYAYGYSPSEMVRMARSFRLSSLLSFKHPWKGILDRDKTERIFHTHLGEAALEQLNPPVYILCAELTEEKMVVFDRGPVVKAVTASCCFPGLFPPYRLDSYLYMDGGIMNRMMANIARQRGGEVIIYSDVDFLAVLNRSALAKRLYNRLSHRAVKNRNKAKVLSRNSLRYMIHQALCISYDYRKENEIYRLFPPEVVLLPELQHIRALQFRKLDAAVQAGRKSALEVIDYIKRLVYQF
ncbi:MAG: patatin-like phospholipase family protein [Spirochaetota bacterium]